MRTACRARTLTWLSLICFLMLSLAGCETSEELAAAQARADWFNSLTPEQQVRVESARLEALGMALSNRRGFSYEPGRIAEPIKGPDCVSNMINGKLQTWCF